MTKNNFPDNIDEVAELSDYAAGGKYMRQVYGRSAAYDIEALRYWRNYLQSIAISRFEWEGLPDGIDPRGFEYILTRYGQAALFMEDGGFLAAQFSNASNINLYWNPNRVLLTSPAGGMWERHAQAWAESVDGEAVVRSADCALCYESLSRYPLPKTIEYYARRLAEIDRIIDVNMRAQRTPYLVRSGEGMRGTSRKVMEKLENNDQFIEFNAAGFDPDNIEVLRTDAPYVAKDLLQDQERILNRALSAMGVDNDPQSDKRERKASLEVLQNNQQVALARRNALAAREQFAKRAYELFRVECWPKWAAPHPWEEMGNGQGEPMGDGGDYAIDE